MKSVPDEPITRFSLVSGGPLHKILCRLGLVEADGLTAQRAAISLALLAWLPPAILAAAQSLIESSPQGWGYFTDPTVPARYLIAIWAMIVTERYADSRFAILARQFREAQLLTSDALPRFEAALAIADRRSSAGLVECIILAVALFSSGFAINLTLTVAGSGWEGAIADGHVELSWAGAATRYLSNPLFLFLVLRWAWWFLVWTALLFRISRLPLQLIPSHPDRCAGLGFLSIYPSVFTGLVFALSCVISSNMLKDLQFEQHPPEIVWAAIAGWLAINLIAFLGPLLVFVVPLGVAREHALLEIGRLATRQHLAMKRKWTGQTGNGEDSADASALPSLSDLNLSAQNVRGMGVSPANRDAAVQIVIAAGIPMLAVVVTLVPLGDLLKWALGKIL